MENTPEIWAHMLARAQAALAAGAPGTAAYSRLAHEREALSIACGLCTETARPLHADLTFALPRILSCQTRVQKKQTLYARQGKTDAVLEAAAAALDDARQQLEQALAETPRCWLDEVRERARRGDQILFSQSSLLLQDLAAALETQSRRAVTLWALEQAQIVAERLVRAHPAETCPVDTVAAARAWAAGQIRMPQAKRAILACHALARQWPDDPADAALCHAVAQGCSTVHTTGHALGLPIYELTALVYQQGIPGCRGAAEARAADYRQRLLYWQQHAPSYAGPWAPFLR